MVGACGSAEPQSRPQPGAAFLAIRGCGQLPRWARGAPERRSRNKGCSRTGGALILALRNQRFSRRLRCFRMKTPAGLRPRPCRRPPRPSRATRGGSPRRCSRRRSRGVRQAGQQRPRWPGPSRAAPSLSASSPAIRRFRPVMTPARPSGSSVPCGSAFRCGLKKRAPQRPTPAGQRRHRGPCCLQRIGLTVSPHLLFFATHLLVLLVRPFMRANLSNKSMLPFEFRFEEILRHILPRVCAEAFARGLVERQDRQHVRKGEYVFAPCWERATPSSVDFAVVAIVHHHVGPVLAVG